MTREEIIEHMKVMGQNAARMDEAMMVVMTRKDCEVVMAAAELLEEQEPVEPVFTPEIEMDMSHWDCGACGGFILGNAYPNAIKYIRPQYCSHCGKPVKWE